MEPEPKHWLTQERRAKVVSQFESSRTLLQQAGLWRATLGYWVRWQASLEVSLYEDKQKEEKYLSDMANKWREANKNTISSPQHLSDEMIQNLSLIHI